MTDKLKRDESSKNVLNYYNSSFDESQRLANASGKLELLRTQDILMRYLPTPPADIADIGGGPGVYSSWLASLGYNLHLVDPVSSHIDHAIKISNGQFKSSIGDARQLELEDSSTDVVLLMGPLYHLMKEEERILALKRILRTKGMIFAVAISRFTSTLHGLQQGLVTDPEFEQIIENDLKDGRHHNITNKPEYFTDAYLHLPNELANEVSKAQFKVDQMIAIESIAWLLPNLQYYWGNTNRQQTLLKNHKIN